MGAHDPVFDGRPARVVMAVDIAEQVGAEDALRRSEARYRDLFENASDLISTVDLDGRLTAVNEAFVQAVGYTREQLIGALLDDFVPPDSRRTVVEAREQKLAGAKKTLYEHELETSDGRRLQIEVSSRLIEEDGVVVGTEAICRDITERRNLEDQLREGQRLESIGRLAGGVAHDFNNLLTVISGYAELLLKTDPESKPELVQIAAAAGRATVLTRQLLAFSRRQVLTPSVVQVNEIVGGLTEMLTRLIGDDVELVAELAPALHPVLADPSQLEQILLNLTVNADYAMPAGGRLTIRTENVDLDAGPHVRLTVGDTGTGMDAETVSHVFEPFFTTKPAGTGTGLGLATVYGIVKQSGGSISLTSTPGTGTSFEILLPRTGAQIDVPVRPARPRAASGTETILVAEDEPSLRQLVTRILQRHGYTVITAPTSPEALRIVEAGERQIDLVLTDLIMPGLSGGDLAKAVTAIRPEIRVVFMSGYADEVVLRERSLDPGSPFLEKPFSADDVARTVRETLDA